MKTVQVFRLANPTEVVVPESSREIQHYSMCGRPPIPIIGGEQPYALPTVDTVTCPIHCLKHAVKGSYYHEGYGPGYVYDELSDTWVKTQHIAMEPELFKMLDTVIRQPYEEREQVRAARLKDAHGQIEKHKRIINNFWALPWYVRVWVAITGGC